MLFSNALHVLYKMGTIGRLALLPSQKERNQDGRIGEYIYTNARHTQGHVSCWNIKI